MSWRTWPFQLTRTFCALMVMPRSRSMSIESRNCSRMSRLSTALVSSRMRSASVDLPWSTWAMIARFRRRSRSIRSVAEGGVHGTDQRLAGGKAAHVLHDALLHGADRHLEGVGGVGRDDDVRERPQRVAVRERLRLGHVERGTRDLVRPEGAD